MLNGSRPNGWPGGEYTLGSQTWLSGMGMAGCRMATGICFECEAGLLVVRFGRRFSRFFGLFDDGFGGRFGLDGSWFGGPFI